MMPMNSLVRNTGVAIWVMVVVVGLTACATTGGDQTAASDYRGQIWELVLSGGLDSKFLLATANLPAQRAELVNGTIESRINISAYGDGQAKIRVKGELNNGVLKAKAEGQAEFGAGKLPLWGELSGQCLGPQCSGTYDIKYADGGFQGDWKGHVYNKEPTLRSWTFGGNEEQPAGAGDSSK